MRKLKIREKHVEIHHILLRMLVHNTYVKAVVFPVARACCECVCGLRVCAQGWPFATGEGGGGGGVLPGTVESLSLRICRLVQLTALYEYSTRVELRVFYINWCVSPVESI